ncbi:MAG: restriction endonuclease subunit S [Chloroflexota bacterium]|nr:restriction endonuclease subunit S [Chloroflexota bacterium]
MTINFKLPELVQYPACKPSGVEWLGDVPENWEVRRLRTVAEMRVSNVDKYTKEGEFPVRLCNYVDVYKNDRISQAMPFMSATASQDEIERFRLKQGDVLITKDSEAWDDIGVPALVNESVDDLICGYHLALLRPSREILGPYLARALQTKGVAHQFHVRANGVTRYGLTHEGIQSARIPIPPIAEQSAIVRYLDHVDRRIRRYVTAKRRLIELLEEERQAVVNQAVSRGLDPDVKLKPSGVEWLGDVPEHWDVRRLRTVAEMRISNVDKHTRDDEIPVRICNYVDAYKNDHITPDLPFMNATATSDEIDRLQLERGDVLITKDSEAWDDIGVPALVTESVDDLICGYHLALLRPRKNIIGDYLARALQSDSVSCQFQVAANGVTRYGLTNNGIQSVRLPLPPLAEQTAIAAYLDIATAEIGAAITRAQRQIELLEEYRSRLIADVVTGKIDVREAAIDC